MSIKSVILLMYYRHKLLDLAKKSDYIHTEMRLYEIMGMLAPTQIKIFCFPVSCLKT
jgi:hypothetical protein